MSTLDRVSLDMSDALWALRRIVRKQGGFEHNKGSNEGQTCDCPQCIAKEALQRIEERVARDFVKGGA